MTGSMVWSLAIDPVNPDVMFVGTGTPSKAAIYRSTDAGKSWQRLSVAIAEECPNVGIPRPTGIAIDPVDLLDPPIEGGADEGRPARVVHRPGHPLAGKQAAQAGSSGRSRREPREGHG